MAGCTLRGIHCERQITKKTNASNPVFRSFLNIFNAVFFLLFFIAGTVCRLFFFYYGKLPERDSGQEVEVK
jgi:hypothetical protein